jgi:DNA-directed RNA polymerase subunit RPC12/RpoP
VPTKAPEARAPTCPSCGAPLPLDFASEALTCRHCSAEVRADEGLRAAMRLYVGDVAAAARKELEARFTGAFYLQNEKAARSIIFGTVGIAIALTGAIVAWSITRFFQMDLAAPYFAALMLAWGASLWAFSRGWGIMYAIPTPKELASARAVRCSACGAASAVTAGAPTSQCRHCQSTLLVPSELAQSLLSESRERATASKASERGALGSATRAGDQYVTPALALVFTTVPIGVVAVIWIGNPEGPRVPLSALWLSFAVLFAIAIAFMWRATARTMDTKRELDARLDALAARVADAERARRQSGPNEPGSSPATRGDRERADPIR